MKAVIITDKAVHLEESEEPTIGTEELLVEVKSAGLNAADILQKNGFYPAPIGIPQNIPGLEFAGTVVDVGSKTRGFTKGDRVMGIVGGAAQAELTTIHYTNALHIPENMDTITAGGFCETYLTAFDALIRQINLHMGERILINGAAGGVGLSAIAIARAINANVVASARHLNHHSAIANLGAIPITPEQVTQFGPYNAILELIGALNLESNLETIAEDGRISIIGVGAGAKAEIDLRTVMAKRIKLFGSTLRARSTHSKAVLVDDARSQLLPLLEKNLLPITIHSSFNAQNVAEAYESFTTPGKLGKILLTFE